MKPHTLRADDTGPRPTDPQFQFLMLLCARKMGDQMLESLARDWLHESGIHVVFTESFNGQAPSGGRDAL